MMDDPLSSGPPPLPMRAEFREAVCRESTRLLRRRSAWPRIGAATAAAAIALAAIVGWRMSRPAAPSLVTTNPIAEKRPEAPLPHSEPVPAGAAAAVLESQAFDCETPERSKRYVAAGDRYVRDHDYAGALRCYREAVETGGAALDIVPEDNWLVMALKLDRQKEN